MSPADPAPSGPHEALLEHRVDAVVARLPFSTDQLLVTVLYDQPRALLVPNDHRLAGKESVTLDDIADEPLPRAADPAWDAFWRIDPRPDGRPAPGGPFVDAVEDKIGGRMLRMTTSVNLPGGDVLPMIGFGTWQLKPKTAYESVRAALEIGYRHVDTATLYQNESDVGRAVKDSGLDREQVFVTTKLRPHDAGHARRTLESSLRLLGTGYVDLWLIHWPPGRDELVSTWQELLAAKDAGLARNVGVSNYSPALIDVLTEATGRRPAVNQIPWSPAEHDPALLAEHRRRGVVVEGYSGLKNTDLKNRVLTGIAERHGVTPAQVVLRWHLEHDIVILPRSSRRERVAANFDLEGFDLTTEDVAAIDSLGGTG